MGIGAVCPRLGMLAAAVYYGIKIASGAIVKVAGKGHFGKLYAKVSSMVARKYASEIFNRKIHLFLLLAELVN
jgi:hypothetical protein